MKIANDPQFDDQNDSADAALDRLLSQARWPEPADAEARLLGAYRRSQIWRHYRRIAIPFAVAASLALMVGGVLRLIPANESRDPVAKLVEPKNLLIVAQPSAATASRPPTAYERLVAIAADSRRAAVANANQPFQESTPVMVPQLPPETPPAEQPAGRPTAASALQSLLMADDARDLSAYLARVIDPSSRREALAAIEDLPDPPVDELIHALNSPSVEQRYAAARALGQICDPELSDRLGRMVDSNMNRREALAALVVARGPSAERVIDETTRRRPILRIEINSLKQEMVALH